MSQQINLFNPVFLKQKKYFSAVTMAQALGMIVLGIGLMGLYVNMQLGRLRPEANVVTAQLEAARAQLASVKATQGIRQKDDALDLQVRRTESEVAALQRVSYLLSQGDIGNASGYSDYMRAFSRQIVDGVWLTEFSIGGGGGHIALAGRALRPELVPAYLSRLSNEPTMHGRSFGVFELHAPDGTQAGIGQPSSYVNFTLRSERTAAGGASAVEAR